MRTDHLQKLLEIARDDMKRRCEQSFYEEHRDQWGIYHGYLTEIINIMNKTDLKLSLIHI